MFKISNTDNLKKSFISLGCALLDVVQSCGDIISATWEIVYDFFAPSFVVRNLVVKNWNKCDDEFMYYFQDHAYTCIDLLEERRNLNKKDADKLREWVKERANKYELKK
jgi:hypothetical protein